MRMSSGTPRAISIPGVYVLFALCVLCLQIIFLRFEMCLGPTGAGGQVPTPTRVEVVKRPSPWLVIATALRASSSSSSSSSSTRQREPLDDPCSEAFELGLALQSWLRVADEVVLLVDDKLTCDTYSHHAGVKCFAHTCRDDKHDRPIASCLLKTAELHSSAQFILWTNSDIAYAGEVKNAIRMAQEQVGGSLIAVGRRIDIEYDSFCGDLGADHSLEGLINFTHRTGALHNDQGLDYFIWERGQCSIISRMPPFLFGVWRWDNWILYEAIADRNMHAVDMTVAITAIHKRTTKGHHRQRLGWEYNDKLASDSLGLRYRDGRTSNTPWVLRRADVTESSDSITEYYAERRKGSYLYVMAQRMNSKGFLAIITLSSDQLPLLDNWLCWAKRIGLTEYVFLAQDKASFDALTRKEVPVFPEDAAVLSSPSSEVENSIPEWRRLMKLKVDFLLSILKMGYGFLMTDVDSIWMKNPFAYFPQQRRCDVIAQPVKKNYISARFVAVAATERGIAYWKRVADCQQNTLRRAGDPISATAEPEDDCFNQKLTSMLKTKTITSCLLNELQFPDDRSFFEAHEPQLNGRYPAVILGNLMGIGLQREIDRIKEWNLWLATANGTCRLPSLPPSRRGSLHDQHGLISSRLEFRMTIRVLTANRPYSLQRLLDSLLASDYNGDTVDLEVYVDIADNEPSHDPDTLNVLNRFKWPFGQFTRHLAPSTEGSVNQWLKPHKAEHDGHVLSIFEDHMSVSPYFYLWTKLAAQEYYLRPDQSDPSLFGIMLERQNYLVGERKNQRHGFNSVYEVLNKTRAGSVWAYQLVSTCGPVFFPRPWNDFVAWANHLRSENPPRFLPCVPTFISNNHKVKNDHAWSSWFVRYAFDRGLYALYFNYLHFDQLKAEGKDTRKVALVIEYTMGSSEDAHNNPTPVASLQALNRRPTEDDLLPPHLIQLYDFHMDLVTGDRALLRDRWRLHSKLSTNKACHLI